MPSGLWLIVFALMIDLLQVGISLSLLGVTTPISAALGLIPLIGTVAGGAVSMTGLVLGFAINAAIGISAGFGLMLAMSWYGLFSWRIFPAMVGEAMPGFNNLPVWSGVVLVSLYKKYKDDKKATAVIQREQVRVEARSLVQQALPARRVGNEVAAAALAILLCVALAPAAHAQTVPPPIQYVVSPEVPGPNTTVTIEVQGVGSFLGSATITWTQDGKTVLQGVGARDYSFTTGAVGKKTVVEVAVDSSQGFFSKTFSFNPSKVNLLWEADTSVPTFYLGRALYSAGSHYKVVAFPTVYQNGARVVPSALSYQWSYNDDVVPGASGLGRATFTRTGDQLQAGEAVGVDVYYGTAIVTHGALTIPANDPKLMLYPRDPLRGEVLETALPQGGIQLTGGEITVQAEPYYFDNTALKTSAAQYAWTLNGEAVSGPDSGRGILTLRSAGAGEGAAALGVSMQDLNPNQFVQSAELTMQIVFGASTGNALLNFFGL